MLPDASCSASSVAESVTPTPGATATVPVSWSPPKRCVAASTRTASMDRVLKFVPSKRNPSVVDVALVRVAEAMDRPAMVGVVASWKPDGETLAPNTVPDSSTTTLAPLKFVSISAGGVVEVMRAEAAGTVTMNVTMSRSPAAMLLSPSSTVTVTVVEVAAVGVPHTVRAVAQVDVPIDSPAGRPLGV